MTREHDRAMLHDMVVRDLEDFAFFLVDLDGLITTWNPGVQRFFGYPETNFIGKKFSEIFTPEDQAKGAPQEEMEKARQDGRSSDVRWHLCMDQSRVFVEGVLTAIKDEGGKLCGFSKIARAVRPQYSAGTLIGTVFEGTSDIIYAMDKAGRFVFANTAAADLLGRKVDDLIGHTREEVLPAARAADLRATDESVMQERHSRIVEEQFPRPEGGDRILLVTKAPWKDQGGNVIGLVAIAQDVTNRVAHEADRERLLREVRRSNEELSAFSHVVAHDLRTPLRAVKTYVELLARHEEGKLDSASLQFLKFAMDGAENMEWLIESLLRYAQSEEDLSVTRVNVHAVVDGLMHTLEPLILETHAEVKVDKLPEVYADPVRLLQLFQNLLVNAITYRGSDPPRIRISAETGPTDHRFAVADNGIGIPNAHFDRIFLPLQRLHSKKVPGTGIGLALVRKIIERHGGRIWVESVVGKGSTFFFTLPRSSHSGNIESR